ncbi:Uncharacterised protein [Staphylococcus aureus]|nr:Uncharacterised protein [Staphylococcus aureus]
MYINLTVSPSIALINVAGSLCNFLVEVALYTVGCSEPLLFTPLSVCDAFAELLRLETTTKVNTKQLVAKKKNLFAYCPFETLLIAIPISNIETIAIHMPALNKYSVITNTSFFLVNFNIKR